MGKQKESDVKLTPEQVLAQEQERKAQEERERIMTSEGSATDDDERKNEVASIHGVEISKEFTPMSGPKSNSGRLALPERPDIRDGALVDDLSMQGWIGDDIRVKFTFTYATFPYPIALPYELFKDATYLIENVYILEEGDVLEVQGREVIIGDRELKGAKQLWLAGNARFVS